MGLGWDIIVFRQPDGGRSPATTSTAEGERVAEWDVGLFGLEPLDTLVKAGKVVYLGHEGLLSRYTGPAEHVMPRMFEGKGPDAPAPSGIRRDEWLLVHAWDKG